MQVVFLPGILTVVLCFVIWPLLQTAAALICLILPDRLYSPDSFFFRTHRFEKEGHIYKTVFHVNSWKHLLPDGGSLLNKRGFAKKRLQSFSNENLQRFLIESARGELTHWLAIVPFWLFGFFAPPEVIWYMLAYALIVNLPCIIAQRYNRPRVHRLQNKKKEAEADEAID